jgi:hypothetical protein
MGWVILNVKVGCRELGRTRVGCKRIYLGNPFASDTRDEQMRVFHSFGIGVHVAIACTKGCMSRNERLRGLWEANPGTPKGEISAHDYIENH